MKIKYRKTGHSMFTVQLPPASASFLVPFMYTVGRLPNENSNATRAHSPEIKYKLNIQEK